MGHVPVAEVLAGTGPLLFDFDGPICSVFAAYPAPQVASELRRTLAGGGVAVPRRIAEETDPLEVLRWTATLGVERLTYEAEAALCMAELAAVANAEPTPFARDAIVTAHEADRRRLVAVVSNNSEEAIGAYLATHQLTEHIDQVIGRDPANPSRMKPHPEPVVRALRLFDATPATAVMIGDSVSDILSAQAAATRSIGYASKPTKVDGFSESGADAIVHSMAEIVHALAASVPTS